MWDALAFSESEESNAGDSSETTIISDTRKTTISATCKPLKLPQDQVNRSGLLQGFRIGSVLRRVLVKQGDQLLGRRRYCYRPLAHDVDRGHLPLIDSLIGPIIRP